MRPIFAVTNKGNYTAMKKIFLILIVSVFALSTAFASEDKNNSETRKAATMEMAGTVVDAATGEALVGVAVTIEATGEVVYTDFDGNFSARVSNQNATAKVTFVSYKEKETTLTVKNENKVEIEQL